MTGLFYSGFTAAQLVAVVPLAWAGDRYDKRLVLGGCLAVGMDWVFYLGALAAFSGVFSFLFMLMHAHGRSALTEW